MWLNIGKYCNNTVLGTEFSPASPFLRLRPSKHLCSAKRSDQSGSLFCLCFIVLHMFLFFVLTFDTKRKAWWIWQLMQVRLSHFLFLNIIPTTVAWWTLREAGGLCTKKTNGTQFAGLEPSDLFVAAQILQRFEHLHSPQWNMIGAKAYSKVNSTNIGELTSKEGHVQW